MSKKDSQVSQGGSNRGFATMSPEEHRKIASLGGKAAHAKGTAHEYTSANAHLNGRKGFAAMKEKYGGEEGFREHMAKIGKAGAAKRNENRSKALMVNMPPAASDNSLPEGEGSVKPMMPGDPPIKGTEFWPHSA